MKRPPARYGPPNPAQDHSSWSLLGANLVTLVMAYFLSWQLADLLVVYWFHFGIFHLAYVVFIFSGVISGDTPNLDLGLLVCCLAFLVNHGYSYMPNVGTMMFTPYLRVIPMHLTVLLGGAFAGTGLFVFMILKTISDILMHWVEHKVMHRAKLQN
jgi:hypothetical protein